MTMLQHGLVPSTGGYQIERSLRFNSADSAYLNRTPASNGNRKTWTLSFWVKKCRNANGEFIFSAGPVSPRSWLIFDSSDRLDLREVDSSNSEVVRLISTQVFRDNSAWYHIVIAQDTSAATSSDRVKLYVNNSQITALSTATYPSQNKEDLAINAALEHRFGNYVNSPGDGYLAAYMADVHFIDGSALTPSSFGENDTDTGVWKPKAYTGSYGTNGFKLTFSDNSGTTSTTLGKDTSGNGNNWTPNNFSVTAGAGNDSLVDTPTPYGTDTGAGGEVRGNYATWNPVTGTSNVTLSNGNLDASTALTCHTVSTIGMTTGLWYWEITQIANGGNAGIYRFDAPVTNRFPNVANQAYVYNGNGYVYDGQANPVGSQYSTYTTNDVIGFAFDATNGKLYVAKNGTWQNSGNPAAGTGAVVTGITTSSLWFAGVADGGGSTTSWTANFGQRPFAYTAPSGFKALCTTNLPTPTIGATSTTRADDYFNTVLYTGDGTKPRTITGVGFQPDLVWIKQRDTAGTIHFIQDAVRGVTSTDSRSLSSNATTAETNYYTTNGGMTAFTSDGFTTNGGSTNNNINANGATYVTWNWKANGAGSSNTAGSITSTVSANTTAGFSIVNWTGSTSSSAQTVGHGLGVTPHMVILKNRSLSDNWFVYHASATSASQYLLLNTTAAVATSSTLWGAGMTSSVVGIQPNLVALSTSNNVIMYCFAQVAGYSAFGSYTGNGSADGPFIYTGFRPRYVMIKRTDTTNWWEILDTSRSPYNVADKTLYANVSDAEYSGSVYAKDFLSNGFKVRGTDAGSNASGGTYIYAAFAENPFKYSLAR